MIIQKYFGEVNKFIKRNIIPIIMCFLIITIRTIFTNNISTAVGYTGADEIGTIASAAFFAGYDWSSVISRYPYYGFGYAMLLSPIFKIFTNTSTIHHMLLLANNILIALCAVFSYKILIDFLHIKNIFNAMLISCITVLYFPLSHYGNYFINETMLYLITWISLYLLLILQTVTIHLKKNIYTILLNITLFYSLLVHSRSVVLLGVIIFVILFIKIVKKEFIVNTLIFFPMLVCSWILSYQLINFVQGNLWLTNQSSALANSTDSLIASIENNLN